MDFKELEYFSTIVKCGNLTHAARQLYVSQPTLSKFLQKLEEDLGLVLFQRGSRRLKLTYAGQRYYAHVERILSQKREMDAEMTDILRSDRGVLYVGIPPFRCSFSLPKVLPIFHKEFPQVQFRIVEAPSAVLDQKLLNGEIDLAFYMEPLHTTTHEIIFDNVDFSYVPGEPVLKHATFTVPDQKLTAIVGDSGSGKSTILNLIAKYYEATGGTISIGGKPINHVAAERVLEQVSMVDQDVFLFDDTIRDNIRHARPNATDAEIEAACREANCDSFIRKMEKGYDTLTGENGNLLSGGERQRISIARAILKNSPILLLDEATASLDIENELAVKQAIANLLKEKKTVVMIAHTLSIVKNADQILVMGDGRIAESGTHEELLAKGGKYAAMWNAEQKISA